LLPLLNSSGKNNLQTRFVLLLLAWKLLRLPAHFCAFMLHATKLYAHSFLLAFHDFSAKRDKHLIMPAQNEILLATARRGVKLFGHQL